MIPSPARIQTDTMPIMAHLVLGYPTLPESLNTAAQYIAAGVEILELQIPFSHPTADGPVITNACQVATAQGVSVRDCLEAIRQLREQFPRQEIIVMSYLNRVYRFGIPEFITAMESLQINHIILPDLPPDVAQALIPARSKVKIVPVLAANTSNERLEKLLESGFDFYYLMSDFKITGSGFSLHPRLKEIISTLKTAEVAHPSKNFSRVGIGFGISTPEQACLIAKEADLGIIGSALIVAQKEGKLTAYLESLRLAFNHL